MNTQIERDPAGLPDESPTPNQTTTRTVKVLGFTPEFVQSLASYLETRPWREVNVYLQSLSQATPFDVTINQ